MGRSKYAIELELSTHDELDIDGKIKTETQNHFLFFFFLLNNLMDIISRVRENRN